MALASLRAEAQTPSPECALALSHLLSVRAATARIEVMSIPGDVTIRYALTPTDLQSSYYDKVTVTAKDKQFFDAIFDSLSKVRVYDTLLRAPDARFGIVLSGADGSQLGSLFLDAFGIHGILNGAACLVTNSLYVAIRRVLGVLAN
jgi:hypothetical protein